MEKLRKLNEHQGVKLTAVTTRVKIDAGVEKIWEALSHFGNVASFHAGVENSVPKNGNPEKAALGVERVCDIKDGNRDVVLAERITEYVEGSHYRYEVFEAENFPLQMMFFGFAIENDQKGTNYLLLTINYRLKPGFLTGLMKWKIKKMEHSILMGYKHYIETQKIRVPIKELKQLNYQFL
jgi:Polyketide cyclase / dehydrase and lipid transport